VAAGEAIIDALRQRKADLLVEQRTPGSNRERPAAGG
jgi:hypothetical protein